jgi:hypothetical protein
MTDDSLCSERNTATHSIFLHQIDRGALPSTRSGFFPAYRMGIGKNSDMVRKIPPWKWDMVGKIPTYSEKFRYGQNKRQGGVREGIINQVILNLLALFWSLIL